MDAFGKSCVLACNIAGVSSMCINIYQFIYLFVEMLVYITHLVLFLHYPLAELVLDLLIFA
jgi:hypothetical protein